MTLAAAIESRAAGAPAWSQTTRISKVEIFEEPGQGALYSRLERVLMKQHRPVPVRKRVCAQHRDSMPYVVIEAAAAAIPMIAAMSAAFPKYSKHMLTRIRTPLGWRHGERDRNLA